MNTGITSDPEFKRIGDTLLQCVSNGARVTAFNDLVARVDSFCASLSAPVGAVAPAPQTAAKFTTDEAREYLVEFMMQHFTDKTFHRYIRGERGNVNLAGDFAWQMATALRALAGSVSALPDAPNEPYLWIDASPESKDRTAVPMYEDIEQVTIIGSTKRFGHNVTPLYLAPPAAGVDQTGWISVDDRLPPVYTDILITIQTGEVVMGCMGQNFWDWPETDKEIESTADIGPTHWMPLPPAATKTNAPTKTGDAE